MVLNKKTSTVSECPKEKVFYDSAKIIPDFGQLTEKMKPRILKRLNGYERLRKTVLNRIQNHKKLILRPKHIHHLEVPESPLT